MMSQAETEHHPLPPFFPEGAVLLMLGSFPPQRLRWKMDFYYPNFQNDMWRIFGTHFFGERDHFLTADKRSFNEPLIRTFLTTHKIALWDTAMEVHRKKGNASDLHLEILRKIDLSEVLRQLPHCRAIVVTGQKALEVILSIVDAEPPTMGHFVETTYEGRALRLYRMPSSSRAYPKPLTEKAAVYGTMFDREGIR